MTVRELVLGTAPEQQDIWNSLLLARLWDASHVFSPVSQEFMFFFKMRVGDRICP